MTLLIGGAIWRESERALDGPFDANASLRIDALIWTEESELAQCEEVAP